MSVVYTPIVCYTIGVERERNPKGNQKNQKKSKKRLDLDLILWYNDNVEREKPKRQNLEKLISKDERG